MKKAESFYQDEVENPDHSLERFGLASAGIMSPKKAWQPQVSKERIW